MMEVVKSIERLRDIIDCHPRLAFLGGAGVSTESGIPDFRSENGLYNQPYKFSPEKILSHNFFFNQPKIFYDYYLEKIINIDPMPNEGHIVLKQLEDAHRLIAIITQNIDGLHHMAGSKNIYELHGNIHQNHCVKCHKSFDIDYLRQSPSPVRCDQCNGLVKPDVVLYGESLDEEVLSKSIEAIQSADLLIVAGTSLNVYPAAGLIRYAKKILLINLTRTSKDIFCDYVYYGKFGETCEELKKIQNKDH